MNWLKRLFGWRSEERIELRGMAVSFGLESFDCDLRVDLTNPDTFEHVQRGTFNAVLSSHIDPGEPYITLHFPEKA